MLLLIKTWSTNKEKEANMAKSKANDELSALLRDLQRLTLKTSREMYGRDGQEYRDLRDHLAKLRKSPQYKKAAKRKLQAYLKKNRG